MSNLIYREIDNEIELVLNDKFGDWITRFGCIHKGEGCYSVVAMDGSEPIGFISTYTEHLIEPLHEQVDAFIDVIEVDKNYVRQGIARTMIELTEKWAKEYGFRQIRSWSSDDKNEAIPMWYALNYCVCPAIMYGEDLCPDENNSPVVGYYVAKMLNAN